MSMLSGPKLRLRKRGRDHKIVNSKSSGKFDQLCPNIRRFGSCKKHLAHLKRIRSTIKSQEDRSAMNADVTAANADAESDDEELSVDLDESDVAVWGECPFRHVKGKLGQQQRDSVLSRLVEFFVVGKHTLTVRKAALDETSSDDDDDDDDDGADPDAPPKKHTVDEMVTRDFVVRYGNTIDASDMRAVFAAYLALDHAPAPLAAAAAAAAEGDADKEAPADVDAAGKPLVGKYAVGKAKYTSGALPLFQTEAEICFNSISFSQYFSGALALMAERGYVITALKFRRNKITTGEALLAGLKKCGINKTVRMLDLSENQFDSMRLLFTLKASFPGLMALGLLNNPITRKPDYREQVRLTLPELCLLDGQSIRRPPLALPHPARWTNGDVNDDAMKYTAALLHCLETGLVDEEFATKHFHPSVTFSLTVDPQFKMSLPAHCQTAVQQAASILMSDIVRAENNGGAVTSEYARPRELTMMSPADEKEVRLFTVAVRNQSRNILLGKQDMHKYARGPLQVFTAYQCSVYPPRFAVDHQLGFATLSVDKVDLNLDLEATPPTAEELAKQKRLKAAAAMALKRSEARRKKEMDEALKNVQRRNQRLRKGHTAEEEIPYTPLPDPATMFTVAKAVKPPFVIVTVHGLMTWRVPSVKGGDAIRCYYDRTLTLAPRAGPARKAARRKKKKAGGEVADEYEQQLRDVEAQQEQLAVILDGYKLYNDQLTLRPLERPRRHDVHQATAALDCADEAHRAVFSPFSEEKVLRLATMFDVDAEFVRGVLERSTSDLGAQNTVQEASQYAAFAIETSAAGGAAPAAPKAKAEEDAPLQRMISLRGGFGDDDGDAPPPALADTTESGGMAGGAALPADVVEKILVRQQSLPFVAPPKAKNYTLPTPDAK
jgi:hypothetical protein